MSRTGSCAATILSGYRCVTLKSLKYADALHVQAGCETCPETLWLFLELYEENNWMSNGLMNSLCTMCLTLHAVTGGHSCLSHLSSWITIMKTENSYLHGILHHLPYDPTTLLETSHQSGSQVSADVHMWQVDFRGFVGLHSKWIQQQLERELQKDTESIVKLN